MSEDKSLGSKLLGLFIETDNRGREPEPAPELEAGSSPADIVAELARSSAPARTAADVDPDPLVAPAPPQPLPAAPMAPLPAAGSTDFESVFREAGMDPEELERVRKAEELLRGLPEATPTAIKRQIVDASLRAFGFDMARITAAAQNQLRALDAYVRVNERSTAQAITQAEQQIQQFNEQIAQLRSSIEQRTRSLTELSTTAQARKAEVSKVLDFFQPPGSGTAPQQP
jgi:hypothetical protein